MIKVVVDAFGGDHSPMANVEGSVMAVNAIGDVEVVLVGDKDKIDEQLASYTYDKTRITVEHAPDVITCNDKPTVAIKTMKDSSMVRSFDLLKNDETVSGMVSVGSTGALLTGAVLKIGRIRGVKRPAFCPILPTMTRGIVGICDSGANVDCDPVYLQQFAIMGSLYLEKAYGIDKPKVALLNIGTEEEKGDQLRKDTYPLLQQTSCINFVGNMESRDFLTGKYDLVVCDGFSGNVLLKSTEGACLEMLKLLKTTFTKNLKNKMGALLLKKDVMDMKNFMDYNNYGGAVLLGSAKTIVKGHGSSKSSTIFHCIEQVYNMEQNKLRDAISEEITKLTTPTQQ